MSVMKTTALALWLAAGLAQAAPPSVEDFQRPPAFSGPVLSPDGSHVAAIMATPNGMTTLAVIPTDKPTQATGIQAFGQVDIASVHWVNDKRLAFTVRPQEDPYSKGVLPGLWTIERDGTGLRQWVDAGGFGSSIRTPKAARILSGWWSLSDLPQDGSDNVVMANRDWRLRLNVVSGERQPLTENIPEHIFDWVLDARFEPLFAYQTLGQGRWQVLRRDGAGKLTPWSVSDQAFAAPPRVPRWVDRAGNLYLIRPSGGPAGRMALHRASSLEPDAPTTQVLASPLYDIYAHPVLDRDNGETVGIHYETDVARTLWLNAELAAAQSEVDRLLPGAVNRLDCSRCLAVPTVLVNSFSDLRPPRYFVYDRKAQRLTPLAVSRPWIPDGSHQQVTTVSARDGMPIAVQLTRPAGVTAPAPTILLIHGGPWMRGNHWHWDSESQFYASRGYLVLEADFRGSLGYGTRHLQAGFKQWGRAMQDDLDDVLAWAAKEGLSDPARVCMVGSSYGGYAALMGLVRSEKKGQLACAVASFAPTDLPRLESRHWNFLSSDTLNFTLPEVIGDPRADAAMLAAHSPLAQAEHIQAPLLLAYGGRDLRVPLAHGSELRDKLAALGRPPQWVVYDDAGHGLWRADQRNDLMKRIEAFLAAHLAPAN